MPGLTTKQIAAFRREHVHPLLGKQYKIYCNTSLVRMHGHFAQFLFLSRSKYGMLDVGPTLMTVGHRPTEDYLDETASAATLRPRSWRIADPTLDEGLAEYLIIEAEWDMDTSFREPLTDEAIDRALRIFSRRIKGHHFSPEIFLAYFNMLRGATTARADMETAIRSFRRYSLLQGKIPLQDWQEVLWARLQELRERLDQPDGLARCRAETEAHAALLKLPPIVWPEAWPTTLDPSAINARPPKTWFPRLPLPRKRWFRPKS